MGYLSGLAASQPVSYNDSVGFFISGYVLE